MNITPQSYNNTNRKQEKDGLELITNYITEKDYEIVLDIGCGSGNITRLLGDSIKHVKIIGIDIDEKMISYAKQNNKTEKIDYFAQDMNVSWNGLTPELKQFESKVSLIYSNYAFHWIPNKTNLFESLNKLLSANGLIVAQFILIPDINHMLNEEQKKFLLCLTEDQQVDILNKELIRNNFNIKTFNISNKMFKLGKNTISAWYPGMAYMYKSSLIDFTNIDERITGLWDIVFEMVTNDTKMGVSNYCSWKQYLADETKDEIFFYQRVVNLVCTKNS